jgi:uncharacterized RDD family membrane protein YckC
MSPGPLGDRVEQLAQAVAAHVITLVLDAIDLDALLARVDIDALVGRIDLDAVVARLDLDAVVQGMDIDGIIGRVDLDALLQGVDIDAIVARLDLDAVLARLDLDAILQRVDINAVVGRVDINQIAGQLDIESLVAKTEIGSIIAKSTTSILTEILEVVRSQGVGLDDFVARWTARVLRRRGDVRELGPPALLISGAGPAPSTLGAPDPGLGSATPVVPGASSTPSGSSSMAPGAVTTLTVDRQGQYAGAVSRAAAFGVDLGASWILFTLAGALLDFTVRLVSGQTIAPDHPLVTGILFVVWEFVYFSSQWTLNGKTMGMALFGLQVVGAAGTRIDGRQATVRTITFPLAIITLGIGFLGIVLRVRRQAWYDRFAGTVVVYSWDARAARLRWLAHGTEGDVVGRVQAR